MRKINRKQGGFTLIEIMIVFVIVAITIAGTFRYYKESEVNRKNKDIAEFLAKVTPDILARHPAEIATLNTAAAIALDFGQQFEVTVGGVTSIVLPGTSDVTFNPNAGNTATVVSFNGMSSTACVDLVEKIWEGRSVIKVGGNNVKTLVTDYLTSQAATIDSECSNATNDVSVEISNFG